MKKLIICTKNTDSIPKYDNVTIITVSEKQIGKCRGCMACRRLNKCINYLDDAQNCIPIITEAEHIDFYLQPNGTIQRLMDRVLYTLDGNGKTFTFHTTDDKETEYLRRLLTWAKYKEVKQSSER